MTSWMTSHAESERFAAMANEFRRTGETGSAIENYRRAAQAESLALEAIDRNAKPRTFGITAISVASLWFKAGAFADAERAIHHALAFPGIPEFAVGQLKDLLQTIWIEQSRLDSDVKFIDGEVLVAVKGGKVIYGGAPLDLVSAKVNELSRYYYRTIEFLLDRPLRRKGSPPQDILQSFRPYLLQVPAGSYQFAIRLERPSQIELFPDKGPEIAQIKDTLLHIISLSASGDDADLARIVPKEEYRDAFLQMTRNFAPTGEDYSRIEIQGSRLPSDVPIVINPESRKLIGHTIREKRREKLAILPSEQEVAIRGTLRGLQLDNDWLEILDFDSKTHRVHNTGDVIDDIVGPMVNHKVIVSSVAKKDGKLYFRDIELLDH